MSRDEQFELWMELRTELWDALGRQPDPYDYSDIAVKLIRDEIGKFHRMYKLWIGIDGEQKTQFEQMYENWDNPNLSESLETVAGVFE